MIRTNKSDVIIVVVACGEKRKDTVLYDFNKDVWNKRESLVEKIKKEYFLSDIELLTYIQYIQSSDSTNNYEDDPNFPNDEEFPVGHPDYPVDVSFRTVARKPKKKKLEIFIVMWRRGATMHLNVNTATLIRRKIILK